MRKRHSHVEDDTEINMTPMLDIVFIMLIFFIVTATFIKEKGIDVSRPDNDIPLVKDRKANILIQIVNSGRIFISGREVDVRAVRANVERLHAENPEGSVIIQVENNAETGILVSVVDQSRQAGVDNVSIATQ